MALYGQRNESMALYGQRNESMALYGQRNELENGEMKELTL